MERHAQPDTDTKRQITDRGLIISTREGRKAENNSKEGEHMTHCTFNGRQYKLCPDANSNKKIKLIHHKPQGTALDCGAI